MLHLSPHLYTSTTPVSCGGDNNFYSDVGSDWQKFDMTWRLGCHWFSGVAKMKTFLVCLSACMYAYFHYNVFISLCVCGEREVRPTVSHWYKREVYNIRVPCGEVHFYWGCPKPQSNHLHLVVIHVVNNKPSSVSSAVQQGTLSKSQGYNLRVFPRNPKLMDYYRTCSYILICVTLYFYATNLRNKRENRRFFIFCFSKQLHIHRDIETHGPVY